MNNSNNSITIEDLIDKVKNYIQNDNDIELINKSFDLLSE